MISWERYNLAKMAWWALQGYFLERINDTISILVHPNEDCTSLDCPRHGTVHRHVPTPEQLAEMEAFIVRSEQVRELEEAQEKRSQAKAEREEKEANRSQAKAKSKEKRATAKRSRPNQKSIAECYRIIALDDPRDPRRDELRMMTLGARLRSMFDQEWNDPEARSIAECTRIWSLEDPRPWPELALDIYPKNSKRRAYRTTPNNRIRRNK